MKLPSMFTLSLLIFSMADLKAQDEAIPDVVSSSTRAVVLVKKPPRYPLKALKQGVEGWVILNFVVQEDGTTDDIVVMDASIKNYFERYAMNAVKSWVYEPATLNGRPVREGNYTARSIFIIKNQDGGVTRPFLSKYKKARQAIEENNLPAARILIDELKAYKKRLIAEVFYLDLVESWYWQGMGDKQATLKHVERALVLAKDVASKPILMSLLRQAIVDNAVANNYGAALSHYETLLKEDEALVPGDGDLLHGVITQVKQILEGENNIVTQAVISKCEYCRPIVTYWRHTLNRNRLSIHQVEGEVNEVEVICGVHSVSLVYEPEIAWSINQDWGTCEVRVSGTDGTTFLLVEHPKET